jgi:Na+/H+ antiporter NhaD/arsenite permease-like protein
MVSLALLGLAFDVHPAYAAGPTFDVQAEALARALPIWSGIPFAGMLLSIALLPLIAPRFWEHRFPFVSFGWAFLLAAPFAVAYGPVAVWKIAEALLLDYLPFIVLLWGLYTVSGGIYLRATLVATPGLNAAFLVAGTLLASVMGTTGASMLLIRPVLRANSWRKRRGHVFVFFIFLVSNIGGILTPLGDPPLFLGFLHGVPFFWTLRLLPHFLVVATIVLAVFVAVDWMLVRKELERRPDHHVPIRKVRFQVEGGLNFVLLAVILGAVLLSGTLPSSGMTILGLDVEYRGLMRDGLILLAGWISIRATPKQVREDNRFNWLPIKEVGYLFFGIFVTIVPVLMILRAGVDGGFGTLVERASEPWHYFWIAGALSSVLDNAPTYLAFFNMALGRLGIRPEDVSGILAGTLSSPVSAEFVLYLKAISAGAVLMGANTYIGNGPNLMVWSIAKESGVKMPGFFGYMLWSLAILVPTFVIVTITLL